MHKGMLGGLRALTLVGFVVGVVAAASAAPAAGSQTPGTWTHTGSMTTPRIGQTAVLLQDGQVLVMGGNNGTSDLSSAELYNPATGKWRAVGDMGAVRTNFTATALPNGEALIAGGEVAGAPTGSAELFNPASGTFSPTGSMSTPRENQSATLLPNGLVLVAGGDEGSGSTAISNADLFNPATRTFTPTGSMNVARSNQTATLLQNGQLLVAGGAICCNGGCCPGTSAELYNPATGNWALTGSTNFPRYGPLAGLLPNGQVLVVCNVSDPGLPPCAAELYTPGSGNWSEDGQADPSAAAGYGKVLLNSGDVLFSGGADTFGSDSNRRIVVQSGAELFDPITGADSTTGSMSIPRTDHTLTLLANGQVLAAGGETQNNAGKRSVTASAELFTP
jgi:Kelch motif protein/galactose oxidase-like protein